MKKPKNKILKNIENFLKATSKNAINNLDFVTAIYHFFIINFFIIFFKLGFIGIVRQVITEYFEVLVICFLIFIIFIMVMIKILYNICNGFLGVANFIYLCLGIISILLNDILLLIAGKNAIVIFWLITILSLVYEKFYRNK